MDSGEKGKRIALVFHGFSGGGIERSMLRLASGLQARGHNVELVVGRRTGELVDSVPAETSIHEIWPQGLKVAPGSVGKVTRKATSENLIPLTRKMLEGGAKLRKLYKKVLFGLPRSMLIRVRLFRGDSRSWSLVLSRNIQEVLRPFNRLEPLPHLVRYLRKEQPDAILAAQPHYNTIAVLARHIAGVPTRVILSERNQPTLTESGLWQRPQLNGLLHRAYCNADAIVAISDGVAEDLAKCAGIARSRISTIYNPVTGPELIEKARAPVKVPWFEPGSPPVILAVGKLHPQKDYATLIRAFAHVRRERKARLVILGAVKKSRQLYRKQLVELADQLDVAKDIEFLGFVENPLAYMARSQIFVLSSAYEGLGNVLIEALACGCPVVSTDCPSGPYEILDGGRYGALVPVGDEAAMAAAIVETLDQPMAADTLKARAELFSVERAVDAYERVLLDPSSVNVA